MPLPDATAQTLYWYGSAIVEDETRTYLVPNATGYFYATNDDALANNPTRAVAIYDQSGQPISALKSDYRGFRGPFQAPLPVGYVSFGSGVQEVISGREIIDVITAAGSQYASQAQAITALQAAINAITSGGVVIPGDGTGGGTTDDPPGYGEGGYGDGGYGA
jgi:hypothetical protein